MRTLNHGARIALASALLAAMACTLSAHAFTCASIGTARNTVATAVTKADVAQAIMNLDPAGSVYRHQDIVDVLVRSVPDTEDAQAAAIRLLDREAATRQCLPSTK